MHQNKIPTSSIALTAIGAAALIAGITLQFTTASVSQADQLRCENHVREIYSSSTETKDIFLPKCSEPGMVAMMDAQANNSSGTEAAQAIASANNADNNNNAFSFALIGIGVGLLVVSIARTVHVRKR